MSTATRSRTDERLAAAMAQHPSSRHRPGVPSSTVAGADPTDHDRSDHDAAGEDGSVLVEYGLLFVLASTLVSLAMKWANGGAVFDLLGKIMKKVLAGI